MRVNLHRVGPIAFDRERVGGPEINVEARFAGQDKNGKLSSQAPTANSARVRMTFQGPSKIFGQAISHKNRGFKWLDHSRVSFGPVRSFQRNSQAQRASLSVTRSNLSCMWWLTEKAAQRKSFTFLTTRASSLFSMGKRHPSAAIAGTAEGHPVLLNRQRGLRPLYALVSIVKRSAVKALLRA